MEESGLPLHMPFAHLGFGIGYIWSDDMHTDENRDVPGKEINTWHSHGILFGISCRITKNLRIASYMGTPFIGEIHFQDKDNINYDYDKIKIFPGFTFTPAFITMEYRFSDHWSVNPLLVRIRFLSIRFLRI